MWCFQFFRRSSLHCESYNITVSINLIHIHKIVHHLLDIPNQGNHIVHSIAQCKEITEALNNGCLIPSVTVVVTLAKVICVCNHPSMYVFDTSWPIQFSRIWLSIRSTKTLVLTRMTFMCCWFLRMCPLPQLYSHHLRHTSASWILAFSLLHSISTLRRPKHQPISHFFSSFWCKSCMGTDFNLSCGAFLMHSVRTPYLG